MLDIYMGEAAEGIELAKQIRKTDDDAAICFISSSNEFYREAYDIQDVNYLLKPVTQCSFKSLLDNGLFFRCHQSFIVNLYCID